jgi:hypothetical protein
LAAVRLLMVWALLFALGSPVAAAPAMDGFLGIPWGSSKAAVKTEMQAKGYQLCEDYPSMAGFPAGTSFSGEFAGYMAEHLAFAFKRDRYYSAGATVCAVPSGSGEGAIKLCAQRLEQMLCDKYGLPTRRESATYPMYSAFWEEIRTSSGSDVVTIKLSVVYPALPGVKRPDKGIGYVAVDYTNNTLKRRLEEDSASDL